MFNRKKKSTVLLQGLFNPKYFDQLKGLKEDVFILEGRPSLKASQENSRELLKRKIKPTLIADNMAGFLFFKDLVKEVWISYQASDDKGALCFTGGLILAVLGKKHQVPVYLFPIEAQSRLLGDEKEILYFQKKKIAPSGIRGYVPLVEWVPAKYITKYYE
jgi:methylthioribose-1-phosphate isomerase